MEEGHLSPAEQRSLAERVFAGDASAEDELVRWFHPRVFTMLVCRTRDRESSQDLTQDVLIATLRALRSGSLQEAGKLAQFVQGIARNLANSHIRTSSMRRPRENPLPPELAERVAALNQAETHGAEFEKCVEQALDDLEPGDRRILLLTMEGRKPREIAHSLELSSEVVRQRKTRAIQRVKDSVKRLSRIGPSRYFAFGEKPE